MGWFMPVISVMWEAEVGKSLSKVRPDQKCQPYLKNNLKAKKLRVWFKW
jgi:hypothetical protein